MKFVRRIGPDPHVVREGEVWDPRTPEAGGCPDIWELDSGDVAIIGHDMGEGTGIDLPPGVSCGPGERLVTFPRRYLIRAQDDIAELT